jgi:hypothetical protein
METVTTGHDQQGVTFNYIFSSNNRREVAIGLLSEDAGTSHLAHSEVAAWDPEEQYLKAV